MATQKSIEELRMEAEELEKQERGKMAFMHEEQERKALEHKIKMAKFRQSTMGKVVGGVSKVGSTVGTGIYKGVESLTRPAQKDTSGKTVSGTGGFGTKVMGALSKIGTGAGTKKPAPARASMSVPQPMFQSAPAPQQPSFNMDALERQFSMFGGSAQAPQQSTIRVSQGVRIKQKVRGKRSKGTRRKVQRVTRMRMPMQQQPSQQGFDLNDVLSRLPQ